MIEGRPRESLVLYDNPIEVSLYSLLCHPCLNGYMLLELSR